MKAPTSPNAKKIYRLFLAVTIAFLLGIIALIALGKGARCGPLFVALLASFAIYVRGSETLKGFAFTIWIFTGVAASMFYPFPFQQWGTYKLIRLIEPLMMIIMFGMGTTMSVRDFTQVFLMPRGVTIGLVLQFTIMPLVGFTLATTFGFPPEVAAGVILIDWLCPFRPGLQCDKLYSRLQPRPVGRRDCQKHHHLSDPHAHLDEIPGRPFCAH